MTRLIDEITLFLESEGFECSRQMRDGAEVICTRTLDGRHSRIILPLEISAASAPEAAEVSDRAYECVEYMLKVDRNPEIPVVSAEEP